MSDESSLSTLEYLKRKLDDYTSPQCEELARTLGLPLTLPRKVKYHPTANAKGEPVPGPGVNTVEPLLRFFREQDRQATEAEKAGA